MVFKTFFNSISLTLRQPVHQSMLSWSSFNQYSMQYSLQATGTHMTTVKTVESGERGMNPVAMTVTRTEYKLSRGSNQRPPVLKSYMLPTEPWGLAGPNYKQLQILKVKVAH